MCNFALKVNGNLWILQLYPLVDRKEETDVDDSLESVVYVCVFKQRLLKRKLGMKTSSVQRQTRCRATFEISGTANTQRHMCVYVCEKERETKCMYVWIYIYELGDSPFLVFLFLLFYRISFTESSIASLNWNVICIMFF